MKDNKGNRRKQEARRAESKTNLPSANGHSPGWAEIGERILFHDQFDIQAFYESFPDFTFAVERPSRTGWMKCHAYGREDNNPSAAVCVDGTDAKQRGRYVDSGTGEKLSLFDFAAKHDPGTYGKDHVDAKKVLAKGLGIPLPSSALAPALGRGKASGKAGAGDWRTAFQPAAGGLARVLVREFLKRNAGITEAGLKVGGAIPGHYPANAPSYAQRAVIAVRNLDAPGGAQVGWTLRPVHGEPLSIYQGEGKPRKETKVATAGSNGLMGDLDLKRLAALGEGSLVWIVEGGTDLLALKSAIKKFMNGAFADIYLVVTPGGCSERVNAALVEALRGKNVAVCFDMDRGGQSAAVQWCKALVGVAKDVRKVDLPYPITEDHGKDVRDFLTDPESGGYAGLAKLWKAAKPLDTAAVEALEIQFPPSSIPADAEGGGVEPPPPWDQHMLAQAFIGAHRLNGEDTFRFWRHEWWRWDGRRYVALSDKAMRAEVTRFVQRHVIEYGICPGQSETLLSVTAALVGNIFLHLEAALIVGDEVEAPAMLGEDGTWAERRNLVVVANGVLDLDKAEFGRPDALQPHTPRWFSPVCLPHPYDPKAGSEYWRDVIGMSLEDDEDRIAVLQEFGGYLLTPDTSHQKFLLMDGEGSNGKSVVCAVLTALVGTDNVSHVGLESFGKDFDLSHTLGKLANIVAEVGVLDKADEGRLKAFTSGDRMFFNRKGIPGVSAAPTARLILATNNRPRFNDRSKGLWRRMIYLPFRLEITKDRRIEGMDKPDWWVAHGHMPGVLNWFIEGRRRLRERGHFTESAVCAEALEDYKREANPARDFLTDRCRKAAGGRVSMKTLYAAYVRFCGDNNLHPLSSRHFGVEVRRVFDLPEKDYRAKSGPHWFYVGVEYSAAGFDQGDAGDDGEDD